VILGFEVGCRGPLHVREERITGHQPSDRPWRVLYASDLHLTARRTQLVDRLVDTVRQHEPDVVCLGGDLADQRSGIEVLRECTARMIEYAPVVAVAGNHDARFGITNVRTAITAGGGAWLPDCPANFDAPGRRRLCLDADPVVHPARDPASRRVLVAHRPDVGDAAAERGYDLVLAGHLHGGQCVLWNRGPMLYPGAWFSRWNGLRFALGDTTMIVSRGAADTLPMRFRCPREVVLCLLH